MPIRFKTLAISVTCALAISLGGLSQGTLAQPAPESNATPAKPLYDEEADARVLIAEALKAVKKENRRVLIQWGANWCGWCRILDRGMRDNRDISRKLMYEYDVVHVDIGKWDKHLDLVEKYGADIKNSGVPYLTILDADGKVIANQDTGSLEKEIDGQPGHDPEKILALLTKHQAPYLSAQGILDDGLADATKQDKRIFLHFGAPWCGWCHRLENWMARPEVAAILAREFVDVKIDVDRTVGGKEMGAKFRTGESRGIPWFAFLDGDGDVIIDSDGPKGNVGFPVAEHEIAHLVAMLRDGTQRLTDEDIAALEASLQQPRNAATGDDH